MPSTKTQIAYFDPLGVYRDLCDELKSKLPLVNLHWNPPSRPLRSIPTLDVDLVEEEAVTHSTPKHQMLGLSSAPYLKLIFIKCEDNETYRQSIRTMIREWLTNNVNGTRDPTEWLIIHYVPSGVKSSSANRFKSTVFDKIRADFNSGSKKDRCIQVRKDFSSEMEYMETWSDAMTRVKEAVLDAFGKRVDLYEDEVNKLEAKKNVMGWNFGTFFIMKEGLALSFENISLYEDALVLYDELETAFGTMSRQKSVASFLSSIGFDYEKEPPSSLMNIQDDTQWRHQIMSNAISLFDFHCYLFSRQAHLMLQIAKSSSSASISALKIGELYLRLRTFLTEMNGLLLSNKKNMFMVAEWSYNVIREFLDATADTQDGLVRQVSEGRGELMLLSRKALETLARNKGYNIEGALSEVSLHEDSVMGEYHVQTKELEQYLKDDMAFYQQYRSVTIAASAEFELADRIRTVNRLSAQLALLDYQLGNYETACSQLENIPTLYSRQGWDIISASLLSVYIKCLMKLDRKEDILTNSLELLYQHKHLGKVEVDELIDNVQNLCDSFESKASVDALFETSVVPYVSVNSTGKYTIQVIISSDLTKDFPLEDATLTLHNIKSSKEKLVFRNESPLLVTPDRVKLEFTCNKFIRGQFQVMDLKMSKGKLLLSKEFNNDPVPTIIDFYPSPNGFWARIKAPRVYDLPERRLILEITAPKGIHVENCKVSFKPITPGLKIQTQKSGAKESIPGGLTVGEFDGSTEVSVPFVADAEIQRIAVRTIIDFTTSSGIFQHIFVDDIDAILAIDVNVHDFFKIHKFFSKFSISCKTHEPVRVFNGSLKSTDHFRVSPPVDTGPTIVFPGGPVSQVFAITKERGQNEDETLLLTIQHCYVREGKLDCLFFFFSVIPVAWMGFRCYCFNDFASLREKHIITMNISSRAGH